MGGRACIASNLIAWCLPGVHQISSRGLVVLDDHAAEHFPPLNRQVQRRADLALLVARPLLAGLAKLRRAIDIATLQTLARRTDAGELTAWAHAHGWYPGTRLGMPGKAVWFAPCIQPRLPQPHRALRPGS